MGNCIFCGKPAGFLRKEHKECRQEYEEEKQQKEALVNKGRQEMLETVCSTINTGATLDSLEQQLNDIAEAHSIDPSQTKTLLIEGWEDAVESALEDGVLSDDEESRLSTFIEHFSLSQNELDINGSYTKMVHAGVLRDVLNGKLSERIRVKGNIPFNFQKNEQLVWLFQDVDYYEQKTRREYVGGSTGGSVRVAKGVYLRASSFKGHPVDRTETIHVGTGILGVTNKHLYFSGGQKSFRVPYTKIVSFEPYSDGIVIQKDGTTAKPQKFITGQGWFTYNLVTNLSQM